MHSMFFLILLLLGYVSAISQYDKLYYIPEHCHHHHCNHTVPPVIVGSPPNCSQLCVNASYTPINACAHWLSQCLNKTLTSDCLSECISDYARICNPEISILSTAPTLNGTAQIIVLNTTTTLSDARARERHTIDYTLAEAGWLPEYIQRTYNCDHRAYVAYLQLNFLDGTTIYQSTLTPESEWILKCNVSSRLPEAVIITDPLFIRGTLVFHPGYYSLTSNEINYSLHNGTNITDIFYVSEPTSNFPITIPPKPIFDTDVIDMPPRRSYYDVLLDQVKDRAHDVDWDDQSFIQHARDEECEASHLEGPTEICSQKTYLDTTQLITLIGHLPVLFNFQAFLPHEIYNHLLNEHGWTLGPASSNAVTINSHTYYFVKNPITALPDLAMDVNNAEITSLYYSMDNLCHEDEDETISLMIEYLIYPSNYTFVQYTTCGQFPYDENKHGCWTMYCNKTITNQYDPTVQCYYDDDHGGVLLTYPYSIWDMTSFGVFDWRYQPNPFYPKTPHVSYVYGVKDQKDCGSGTAFAAANVAQSAIARHQNLFVDSDLIIPQTAQDSMLNNYYFPDDLSEQDILDGMHHLDEHHNWIHEKNPFEVLLRKGGMGLIFEQYRARCNRTQDNVTDCTHINDRYLAHHDHECVNHLPYNPKIWGLTNYYGHCRVQENCYAANQTDGLSPISEKEIRDRLEDEGVFQAFIATSQCQGLDQYTGVGLMDDLLCGRNLTSSACTNASDNTCDNRLPVNHAISIIGYGTQYSMQCIEWTYGIVSNITVKTSCLFYAPVATNYWIVQDSQGIQTWNPCFHAGCDPLYATAGIIKVAAGKNIGRIEESLHGVVPELFEICTEHVPHCDHRSDHCHHTEPIITQCNHTIEIPHLLPVDVCTDPDDEFNWMVCYNYLCDFNRSHIDDRILDRNPIWPNEISQLSYLAANAYNLEPNGFHIDAIDYGLPGHYCDLKNHTFCGKGFEFCTSSYNNSGTDVIYNTPAGLWSNPINEEDWKRIVAAATDALAGLEVHAQPVSSTSACAFWVQQCSQLLGSNDTDTIGHLTPYIDSHTHSSSPPVFITLDPLLIAEGLYAVYHDDGIGKVWSVYYDDASGHVIVVPPGF